MDDITKVMINENKLLKYFNRTYRKDYLHPPKIIYTMRVSHGRMNYKDTKPYMSAFLSVDLLTEFAAFCLTDYIDRRYIDSWFVFSTQFVNCCPHGRRKYNLLVYCYPSTVPSL